MRIPGPSRRLRSPLARMSPTNSPHQPRALRLVWWALMSRSAQTPVGHDPTVQQPAPGTRSRGPGEEHSGSRSRWWRPWVGKSIDGATPYLSSASRAGVRSDIVATPVVTQPPIRLTQHQALSAPQPAVTADSPTPATRVRVVLLPHARTEPTATQANNRRTGRVTRLNQGDSSWQHLTQGEDTTVA